MIFSNVINLKGIELIDFIMDVDYDYYNLIDVYNEYLDDYSWNISHTEGLSNLCNADLKLMMEEDYLEIQLLHSLIFLNENIENYEICKGLQDVVKRLLVNQYKLFYINGAKDLKTNFKEITTSLIKANQKLAKYNLQDAYSKVPGRIIEQLRED